ncbi:MAG: NAD(P)-binding protein [Gammaproteobacteria bacterium]|nr:NAD(P)-binding protein [Gammaproteobacteria bacterium]
MKKNITSKDKELGLDLPITRRDFIGSTLAGTGASLLSMKAPGLMASEGLKPAQAGAGLLGPDWTGPGGTGDYARANGNTHEVVNAAHALRDGQLDQVMKMAEEIEEEFDLIIVGGGFSGFGAGYAFKEEVGDKKKCHILDNHAMFGGEAKHNEFEVNGHRLYGPQGSNSFYVHTDTPYFPEIWHKLKLPTEFEFSELSGTDKDIVLAPDNFGPMMKWPERASTGYFYDTEAGSKWVKDAQKK